MTQTQRKSPWQLAAILVLAVAGLALAVLLSKEYYDVRNGMAGFRSLCNIGEKFNCGAVAASSWASLVDGIPLSSFAGGWFLTTILVGLMTYMEDWRRDGTRVLFGLSLGGLAFSAFYLFVMVAMVKTFCLYCLLLDAVNVGIFLAALGLKPESLSKHPIGADRWKVIAGTLAASMLVSIVLMKSFDTESMDAGTRQAMVERVLNAAPLAVNAGPEFPSMGPQNAPITIVEFSDFQCPFCRMGAFSLNAVMNANPGKVRIVFRNYPLDQSCNPKVQHRMHQFACEAARAAVCAQKQGKFDPVYQELFERQADLGKVSPTEIASSVAGVDASALKACMASPEAPTRVTQDIEEGNRLGIESTPTFFVNGRKVEGGMPAPVWNEIIERLLSSQGK